MCAVAPRLSPPPSLPLHPEKEKGNRNARCQPARQRRAVKISIRTTAPSAMPVHVKRKAIVQLRLSTQAAERLEGLIKEGLTEDLVAVVGPDGGEC
ncbi:hypothetical protein Naga_101650g2 [Nannochloropsis gaditana]|uniref:Uncharacterized protein n=1 Tax=Nannochloropsis gaditana TaxID=72520 RepID=W7T7N1_9STRA|nr:hypothetical protein Naga_101650g2 [Nannochloropsis gaditana]